MSVYNETLSKIMFIFVADADELQKDENLGKTTGTWVPSWKHLRHINEAKNAWKHRTKSTL